MATISRAPSGRWRAQVRHRGHPAQSRTFDRYAEARQWAAQIEGALTDGGGGLSLAAGLRRYSAEETPKKRGAAQETNRVKVWLKSPLAKMIPFLERQAELKVMARKAAIYARVSTTNGQTTANQVRALRAAAKRFGWSIVATYQDEGISGARGRDKRPGLDQLLRAAARREFDVLLAWSVDRLGRSLQDLCSLLSEIHSKGIDLYLDRQGIDTTTPAGKALFQMMGVFAEFERAMARERSMAGQARARAEGKRIGRPMVSQEIAKAIADRLLVGWGESRISRDLRCGVSTVRRVKAELAC